MDGRTFAEGGRVDASDHDVLAGGAVGGEARQERGVNLGFGEETWRGPPGGEVGEGRVGRGREGVKRGRRVGRYKRKEGCARAIHDLKMDSRFI